MPLPFHRRLALNKWALGLFGVEEFKELGAFLSADTLEGFDQDNISKFLAVLGAHLPEGSKLTRDVLLGYDQNIVRHWQAIAEPRTRGGKLITPKYFQYLSLLFTEIYLDKFFQDKDALLVELNAFLANFNSGLAKGDRVDEFKPDELNKIAFWSATGSGKTLIMHVNILQFQHYLEKAGRQRELNRVILLTPNESLSLQHLEEFRLSRMQARLFRKDQTSRHLRQIEIIDVHKLKDESGDKTVAVESFEGNNLVLVDEGHKGAGGKEWMDKRNKLCEQGFSFEYSATFGQSLKAANKRELTQQYAKCILFDYSYRYFYRDGYGKDYKILNLAEDTDQERTMLYLTACLLSFYQQVRLYEDNFRELRPFNIHRPLWVCVGRTVTGGKTKANKRSASDVVAILRFLSSFAKNRRESVSAIERIFREGLAGGAGSLEVAPALARLAGGGESAEDIFDDVLARVFNSRVSGPVHVEYLKGGGGELALKIGEGNQPFGVINVGEAKVLWDMCVEVEELKTLEKDFSESIFQNINDQDSAVNLLIGSKKFTEGWNSWRVSTMGLMNFGRKEGSEIVQFFGRGVRLKGYDFCLKRSSEVRGVAKPECIKDCETLNIFGVRADYMQQFKEYLEEEGLPVGAVEIVLPVVKNLGKVKLKVPGVAEGVNFKKDRRAGLGLPPAGFSRRPVVLDWYPKIQAIIAQGLGGGLTEIQKNEVARFSERHLAFVNWNDVYFELVRYKTERKWHNLHVSKGVLAEIMLGGGWYKVLVPQEDIEPTNFANIRRCQEIVVALLKKYCDRYYGYKKDEYEKPHMGYREITPSDDNFFENYKIEIDESAKSIIDEIEKIKKDIESGVMKGVELMNMHSIVFSRHLYRPLLHIKDGSSRIHVSPVALNKGERDFVLDLQMFYAGCKDWFKGRELYLLRNQSRGRGIGFFEAENFYPDFIVWLVEGDKQRIAFVDPKGILRLQGLGDPKIMFHKKIKELENRLGDKDVSMSSFIVSNTGLEAVKWWSGGDKAEFTSRNVLFQIEDKDTYIQHMLTCMAS